MGQVTLTTVGRLADVKPGDIVWFDSAYENEVQSGRVVCVEYKRKADGLHVSIIWVDCVWKDESRQLELDADEAFLTKNDAIDNETSLLRERMEERKESVRHYEELIAHYEAQRDEPVKSQKPEDYNDPLEELHTAAYLRAAGVVELD